MSPPRRATNRNRRNVFFTWPESRRWDALKGLIAPNKPSVSTCNHVVCRHEKRIAPGDHLQKLWQAAHEDPPSLITYGGAGKGRKMIIFGL